MAIFATILILFGLGIAVDGLANLENKEENPWTKVGIGLVIFVVGIVLGRI